MLCVGCAQHPGPTGKPSDKRDLAKHVGIGVLNVGVWLIHGDAALESDSDFLLITETRLITSRSRNECAKLCGKI